MKANSERVSFGGKIPLEVKERIDAVAEQANVRMGFLVERMAVFVADMSPPDMIRFCYPELAKEPEAQQKRQKR